MEKLTYKELLDAGVHFGHLKRKWNPKMQPYIFTEHKGIHIIDLNRTTESLERSANAMRQIAKSGRKIMFVATKKQARDIVQKAALSVCIFLTDLRTVEKFVIMPPNQRSVTKGIPTDKAAF